MTKWHSADSSPAASAAPLRQRRDFPGLALEWVHWLADRGILMSGVEAINAAP